MLNWVKLVQMLCIRARTFNWPAQASQATALESVVREENLT